MKKAGPVFCLAGGIGSFIKYLYKTSRKTNVSYPWYALCVSGGEKCEIFEKTGPRGTFWKIFTGPDTRLPSNFQILFSILTL